MGTQTLGIILLIQYLSLQRFLRLFARIKNMFNMQLGFIKICPKHCKEPVFHCLFQCSIGSKCGSGSSFLPQNGSRSRKPNLCGSKSWSYFYVTKFNFFNKNIVDLGKVNGRITFLHSYNSLFERLKFRIICLFQSISYLMDPDPDLHSQYGSGFRSAKSVRIWIHNTGFLLLNCRCTFEGR